MRASRSRSGVGCDLWRSPTNFHRGVSHWMHDVVSHSVWGTVLYVASLLLPIPLPCSRYAGWGSSGIAGVARRRSSCRRPMPRLQARGTLVWRELSLSSTFPRLSGTCLLRPSSKTHHRPASGSAVAFVGESRLERRFPPRGSTTSPCISRLPG